MGFLPNSPVHQLRIHQPSQMAQTITEAVLSLCLSHVLEDYSFSVFIPFLRKIWEVGVFFCLLVLNFCTQLSAQQQTHGKGKPDSYMERQGKERAKKGVLTSEWLRHITQLKWHYSRGSFASSERSSQNFLLKITSDKCRFHQNE